MKITKTVEKILNNYESDNPGTKRNLSSILMSGKLSGTGKMVILPVDQGFEHGPVRSFAANDLAYDPNYHFELAIEAGLNAYAAPLGMLEVGASKFAGAIPTILKINSSNSISPSTLPPYQAITGSVQDALRLGCAAIGFTIYPGSDLSYKMIDQISSIARDAKACGLAVVIWSYPRGANISSAGETAIDIVAYAAHIAALIGAHIIKVKPPTNHIENNEAKKLYLEKNIPIANLADRIAHIKQSCFAGKRLVVFSGGAGKSLEELYNEISSIAQGGGDGSIIGRNSFQRPRAQALQMLEEIITIYKGKNEY